MVAQGSGFSLAAEKAGSDWSFEFGSGQGSLVIAFCVGCDAKGSEPQGSDSVAGSLF